MENEQNLAETIESILFIAGSPVELNDIVSKLNVTKKQIEKAVEKLKEKYSGESGILLLEFNNKLQLSTNSSYSTDVSVVLNPIRARQLSKATLETLSIVAYKQPVTRLEIEEVRGVSSDYAISILLEHNLITIVGRKDTVGKPVLFGTTDEFLKRFNLKDINSLPSYDELIDRIKTIRSNERDESLYREYDVPDEEIKPDETSEQKSVNQQMLDDIRKKIEKIDTKINIKDEEIISSPSTDNPDDIL